MVFTFSLDPFPRAPFSMFSVICQVILRSFVSSGTAFPLCASVSSLFVRFHTQSAVTALSYVFAIISCRPQSLKYHAFSSAASLWFWFPSAVPLWFAFAAKTFRQKLSARCGAENINSPEPAESETGPDGPEQ